MLTEPDIVPGALIRCFNSSFSRDNCWSWFVIAYVPGQFKVDGARITLLKLNIRDKVVKNQFVAQRQFIDKIVYERDMINWELA